MRYSLKEQWVMWTLNVVLNEQRSRSGKYAFPSYVSLCAYQSDSKGMA